MQPKLVLASSSPYRRDLLARLRLPFEVMSPDIDETPRPNEVPPATALRLAQEKAQLVAHAYPDALIIGSDQVALLGAQILGKPHNFENARLQLLAASGHTVVFHTALCVLDSRSGENQGRVVETRVTFRHLDEATIARYLETEQPYNCAGSAKSEGLGITLIERFEGEDPSALIGLPLIALTDMLHQAGLTLP